MPEIRSEYSSRLNFFGRTTPAALAGEFGTPLYVYNEAVLRQRCRELRALSALPGFSPCYSTKANGNPHLLRLIREEGLQADAMSPGEVALLRAAGFSREEICYVCNNVSAGELAFAAQNAAVVSVDSVAQIEAFGRVNPGGEIMVRLNPGIGAGHHQKVVTAGKNTKFGVVPEDFAAMSAALARHRLKLIGLNQHVGSLFLDPGPYLEAVAWLLDVARCFLPLRILDFGGGFGMPYHKYEAEARLDLAETGRRLEDLLSPWIRETGFSGRLVIEPGRYIVAESAILLGRVQAVKNNGPVRYVGTDIGFNTLIRPAMYDSFHDLEIYPLEDSPRTALAQTIVGNICETGDILAKDRLLPEILEQDLLGVLDAGAYGYSMSSSYTQRFRPAEVLIRADGSPGLIRRRETAEDLLALVVDPVKG
ncbi:MAG: diaminopimelate decarboxylase [Deltaproteobacteria bacterium]|jgi:diaminopimelate decarboxylase|nr:diaminopimelate decarboxylase [Deltaproteobacteria bacterium]